MITLRPYQRAAIDAIYAYFGEHSGHPLIVIPTAGGKSLVMARFIQEVLESWPDQRIVIITHVRELIAQDFAELMRLWPDAPAGIYSAGLARRDIGARILFAGIQSIHKRAALVQQADLVLIDEAHLIPRASDTMYRHFLDDLAAINPSLKVIGFTATPYRLDSGMLDKGEDALFTDIAFEVSVRDLIDAGYLAPLIGKATEIQLDVAGVGTRGGEYIPKELQAAVDRAGLISSIIDEIVTFGAGRRSWLLFCAGVDHALHVRDAVRARGTPCESVFGDTPPAERDRILTSFKKGELRALSSMGVLTTGFNAPSVDLIAMLRPTKSTGLYVQMAGRGTRIFPGKDNCLVLDFAGNVARHGPIDAVRLREKSDDDGEYEPPVKICEVCRSYVPVGARVCPDCGYEFPPPPPPAPPAEPVLERTASELPVLSFNEPQWLAVREVAYFRHEKPGKPPSLRVEYRCGMVRHQEWVCLEHTGYARQKAVAWWQRRAPGLPVPVSIEQALDWADQLQSPQQIAVRPSGRFTEVVAARFAEESAS